MPIFPENLKLQNIQLQTDALIPARPGGGGKPTAVFYRTDLQPQTVSRFLSGGAKKRKNFNLHTFKTYFAKRELLFAKVGFCSLTFQHYNFLR